MFDNTKYIQHLEEENKWLRSQVEELQGKLFKAMRLTQDIVEGTKPMKYDPDRKEFVEMNPEQIYSDAKELQDLLSQNI